MHKRVTFEEITRIDGYGLLIYFSDNTHARYTVEELANLRPQREPSEKIETRIGPVNE